MPPYSHGPGSPPTLEHGSVYLRSTGSLDEAQDSRASSNQSLNVSVSSADTRRILLLIFVHGFMGDETSFQSFPAHVHNLVAILLAESHVVRTKVYPRYRSRKAVQVATEGFSKWLAPHESPTTDVVLLGHSMGGILSAEVALLPSVGKSELAFRHSLIGTINLDVPFLGVHPGVIKSGLGSLFRSTPKPAGTTSSNVAQLGQQTGIENADSMIDDSTASTDANSDASSLLSWPVNSEFNPAFANDVRLTVRKGWRGAWHFVQKHSNDLFKATQELLASHYEFGSCLADYEGLKIRYRKIRSLEESDPERRQAVFPGERPPSRVRFINYYTASTGRPKLDKSPSTQDIGQESSEDTAKRVGIEEEMGNATISDIENVTRVSGSDVLSIEGRDESEDVEISARTPSDQEEQPLSKTNTEDDPVELIPATSSQSQKLTPPPLPPRVAYQMQEDAEPEATDDRDSAPKAGKKKRDGKFCMLPSKDANGERDPTWVRLRMEDVDEVGAHCGIFLPHENYGKLVGDVGDTIEQWVHEAMTDRMIHDTLND